MPNYFYFLIGGSYFLYYLLYILLNQVKYAANVILIFMVNYEQFIYIFILMTKSNGITSKFSILLDITIKNQDQTLKVVLQ